MPCPQLLSSDRCLSFMEMEILYYLRLHFYRSTQIMYILLLSSPILHVQKLTMTHSMNIVRNPKQSDGTRNATYIFRILFCLLCQPDARLFSPIPYAKLTLSNVCTVNIKMENKLKKTSHSHICRSATEQ